MICYALFVVKVVERREFEEAGQCPESVGRCCAAVEGWSLGCEGRIGAAGCSR